LIVHGSTGGGWDWKNVARLLTDRGHVVYRPTLTGLGEKCHLSSPDIGLNTHIDDIANVILFEDLHDAVLVGHSYAGMVITGVLDRLPERIKHVVFLDAFVPENGESFMDVANKIGDNNPRPVIYGIYTPAWVNLNSPPPCDVPQSFKTLTDPVSFQNPAAKQVPATCILFVEKEATLESLGKNDLFHSMQDQRAKARGWSVRVLQSDHNAQRSHANELVELLELSIREGNSSS